MRLREIREACGYKQYQVAEYLHIERQTYSRYECEEREPDIDRMCKMCDLFECTLDELVGRNTSPTREIEGRPEPAYSGGIKRTRVPKNMDEFEKAVLKLIDARLSSPGKGEAGKLNVNVINQQ
ncbi:hypothetical protein AGMMS49992_03010 [Clostridia bacterium]|nr:hypothetical protein AGMMS49992_03010 [Clostridia bacterium]